MVLNKISYHGFEDSLPEQTHHFQIHIPHGTGRSNWVQWVRDQFLKKQIMAWGDLRTFSSKQFYITNTEKMAVQILYYKYAE
jgi:hypothetical protein